MTSVHLLMNSLLTVLRLTSLKFKSRIGRKKIAANTMRQEVVAVTRITVMDLKVDIAMAMTVESRNILVTHVHLCASKSVNHVERSVRLVSSVFRS